MALSSNLIKENWKKYLDNFEVKGICALIKSCFHQNPILLFDLPGEVHEIFSEVVNIIVLDSLKSSFQAFA